MLHLLVALLLASATQAGVAQPNAEPVTAPNSTPTIAGTVTDPAGKPVARALVLVRSLRHQDDPPLSTRTNDEGSFRIELTSRGPVDVRVEAAGFAAQELPKQQPGTPLHVRLAAGVWVRGIVRDAATKRPIEGALVQARSTSARGGGSWEPKIGLVETRTDVQGRFRLDGLEPGRQNLRATARGYGAQIASAVSPGASADLLLLPGATIQGSVRDTENRPIAGAIVDVESSAGGHGFHPAARPEQTDDRGHFEVLGLDGGEYRLIARDRARAPAISGRITLAQGGEEQIDLLLPAGVPVSGRLVDGDQKPVRGSCSIAEVDGQAAPSMLAETSKSTAGADGRFRIEHMPPGRHVIAVAAPGYKPKRVDVTVGTKPVDVGEVALETGLVIRGRVVDESGTPVADAELEATPAPVARRVYDESPQRSSRSEADGRFVVGGLTEGTYDVTAQAYGFGRVVKPIVAGASNVVLTLQAAGLITGLVVDEAGKPVTDYRVAAQVKRAEGDLRGWQRPYLQPVAAEDGRFTLEGPGANTYAVDISSSEYVPVSIANVAVQNGAATDLGRIVLRAGGTLRGVVVDTAGAPVAAATVTPGTIDYTRFVERPRTTSNDDGSFALRGFAAGQVEVAAQHPSYAEGRASVEIDPARGPAEVTIVLGQGARVQGSARQRDGSPIPAVTIQLTPLGNDGRPRSQSPFSAETAADGSYSFERVPAGRAMVFMMTDSRAVKTSAQSKAVELQEGQLATVDFVVRDIRVTGVLTRQQLPVANASLRFLPQNHGMTMTISGGASAGTSSAPMRNMAITGADGRFELLLDNFGRYGVAISAADGQATHFRTIEIPDVESHELEIELGGTAVSGVVLEQDTERPLQGARLSFMPTKGGGVVSGESGGDGRFQVDLEPGSYRVDAFVPEFAAAHLEVEVPTTGEMRVLLTRGSSLDGKVTDEAGRGVGGVAVSAFGSQPEATSGFPARTLPDGSFHLTGLSASAYTVFADAGASGRFGSVFGVRPGEKPVQLVLRPAARVSVRLVGPDGKPVSGAHAQVEQVDGSRLFYGGGASESDAGGVIDMIVPAGQLQIRAMKDKLMGTGQVAASAGNVSQLDVQLAEMQPPK
jgi:protocatechuate 3,4-dioxygenase beta subunit